MSLGNRLFTGVVAVVVTLALAPPAAASAGPTTLTLTGTAQHADEATPLQVGLVDDAGTPVPAAEVVVERREGEAWVVVATLVTDESGRAVLDAVLARRPADNAFRAKYAGDGEHAPAEVGPVQIDLIKRNTRLTIGGPDRVVDETSVEIRVRWQTGSRVPVPGVVRLYRRTPGGDWALAEKLVTGEDGRAATTVRPRVDTRWQARAYGLAWAEGDRSGGHGVDNLPPGVPVDLPRDAPRPRIDLPDQRRAVGGGANPTVRRLSNPVWGQMTGRSWHRGCPVGRASLRLLRINYWDFAGYRRRGELVAHVDAVGQMRGALTEMYRQKLPIRSMYRVDRFGWSDRLHGADDYRSMAAGNTSAFNCRDVVGRPGTRSPHAYGRSLDLNTWENPYRSRQGTVPNTWWMPRSHPRVAWRSREHRVVEVMARHGLRWTYGNGDTQHFDAGGGPARLQTRWVDCVEVVCS